MIAYLSLAVAIAALFLAMRQRAAAERELRLARRRDRFYMLAIAALYRSLPTQRAASIVANTFRAVDANEAAALAEILGRRDPASESGLEALEASARLADGQPDDYRRQLLIEEPPANTNDRERFMDEIQRTKSDLGPTLLDIAIDRVI